MVELDGGRKQTFDFNFKTQVLKFHWFEWACKIFSWEIHLHWMGVLFWYNNLNNYWNVGV